MKKSMGAKTLVFPTPTWIVGTYDAQGKPNGAAVAWGGICNSEPPSVAVSLRKATYSHGNLTAREAFTVSVASEAYARQADYFGIASGRDGDKFAATGLTPTRSELVDAPYVEEFPLVLECKLVHAFELGLHTQFVGQIVDVKADESVLDDKGRPAIEKVRPFVFAPSDRTYYGIGRLVGKAFSMGKEI